MTPPISDDLLHVLTESQRLGFLGERPIPEVVEHARSFVTALSGVTGTVIDLGSGGGVPGLVIASDRPDLSIVLIDRRAKRTDFLSRVVRRLRWSDRVRVIAGDVGDLIVSDPAGFDAAVARGFGPPEATLTMAAALVGPGGRIVISEPPSGDRWAPELLGDLGVSRVMDADDHVAVFVRDGST